MQTGLAILVHMGWCPGAIPRGCKDLQSGTPRKLLGGRDFLAEFGLGAKASSQGSAAWRQALRLYFPSMVVSSFGPLLFLICPKKYTLTWGTFTQSEKNTTLVIFITWKYSIKPFLTSILFCAVEKGKIPNWPIFPPYWVERNFRQWSQSLGHTLMAFHHRTF